MGRLLAIGLVVAAACIAVIAVNGPGEDKPKEVDAAAPARQSTQVAPAAPGQSSEVSAGTKAPHAKPGAVVHMRNLRFVPGAVSIDKGQSVRFVNDDTVAHTVLEDFGPRSGEIAAVDSKRILPGESFTFVPHARGLIPYVCTLHPTVMVGQILVGAPAT